MEPIIFVVGITIKAVMAIYAVSVAEKYGRRRHLWGWLTFIFGLPALISMWIVGPTARMLIQLELERERQRDMELT